MTNEEPPLSPRRYLRGYLFLVALPLVTAAHDAGLTVIAHVEGEGTMRLAYDNGIDRLAHTPWTERFTDSLSLAQVVDPVAQTYPRDVS